MAELSGLLPLPGSNATELRSRSRLLPQSFDQLQVHEAFRTPTLLPARNGRAKLLIERIGMLGQFSWTVALGQLLHRSPDRLQIFLKLSYAQGETCIDSRGQRRLPGMGNVGRPEAGPGLSWAGHGPITPTLLSLLIFTKPRESRSAPTGAELPVTLQADWIVRRPFLAL